MYYVFHALHLEIICPCMKIAHYIICNVTTRQISKNEGYAPQVTYGMSMFFIRYPRFGVGSDDLASAANSLDPEQAKTKVPIRSLHKFATRRLNNVAWAVYIKVI